MFSGFNYSVKGASHEAKGTVCQDSSAHFAGDKYAVAVVADGHGSKKHFRSNVGSELAVKCTLAVIKNFCNDMDKFNRDFPENHKLVIKNIQKQIISRWNAAVLEHFKKNPITSIEKSDFTATEFEKIPMVSYYGTTLVAVVACENFTFGFQIGDGSLVGVFEDGTTKILIDYEESNPANITSSICNANAASMFDEFYIADKKLLAAYVSTDGLYTSFGSDDDFLAYHTIITGELTEVDSFETAVMKNINKRSHYGTQDDISISCVYDKKSINEKLSVIKQKIQENRNRKKAKVN